MATKILIAGAGEIGKALYEIFKDKCEAYLKDREDLECGKVDILHIAFPYSPEFVREVKGYQKKYQPTYTIIHSTVRPGTSRKCNAVHSPVIGLHPFLVDGIKTFVKFLAGEFASEVADHFRRAGIKVYLFDKPEITEAMKILDTTFYALCIEYAKEVKRICKKLCIPFEAWTIWTENYNRGYKKLGFPEYQRPNLVPIMKKQGGHCTLSNLELLETIFTNIIKELNQHEI